MSTLKKPTLSPQAMMAFVEGGAAANAETGSSTPTSAKDGLPSSAANAPKGQRSGLVPVGDARLTANIRADLHRKLKMRAVLDGRTMGQIIEEWIESWPESSTK